MNSPHEVAIIEAGIIRLATAKELSLRFLRRRIVVLEKEATLTGIRPAIRVASFTQAFTTVPAR